MVSVSAIVLCAGLSRRMGDDNKLLLPIGDKPMVEIVIERLLASEADEIILVGSELTMEFLTPFSSERVKITENINYKEGMTSSIQAGVVLATSDGYMICLGDQPAIETTTYDTIIDSFKTSFYDQRLLITVPFYDGKKGNPVIFSSAFREDLLTHPNPEGCREIIMHNPDKMMELLMEDSGILQDIDTPEDYRNFVSDR